MNDSRNAPRTKRVRLSLVLTVILSLGLWVAAPLFAETSPPGEDQTEDSTLKSESATILEETSETGVGTVTYLVPEGGYLTDPGIAQDPPRQSALNRMFPLWKSVAGDHALPRPWSVGVVTYWQTQNYDIVEAAIGIGDIPPVDLDIEGSFAFIDAKSANAKIGLWLLPFLNLTGTVGYNVVETDIHLSKAPIGIAPPGGPGQSPEIIFGERTLDLDFEGPFWAASATFVGGWKNWWGSGVVSYADAKLDATVGAIGENRFTTERIQLNAGYNFHGVNMWIGAQYMEEESHQQGSLEEFTYDVLIRRTSWTPKLGMHTVLQGRWEVTIEGGFGDLTSAMFMLGYRL
jgi:hypothetical protein